MEKGMSHFCQRKKNNQVHNSYKTAVIAGITKFRFITHGDHTECHDSMIYYNVFI